MEREFGEREYWERRLCRLDRRRWQGGRDQEGRGRKTEEGGKLPCLGEKS